jgi:PAS domain-containing protein
MPPENRTDREVSAFGGRNPEIADRPHEAIFRWVISLCRKTAAGSAALKDLITLAIGSILALAFSSVSGGMDAIERWGRENNLSGFPVGETATAAMILGIATAIFLARRHRVLNRDPLAGTGSGEGADPVESVRPYMELEHLFRKVVFAKKEWEQSLDSIRDMVILSDLDGTIHRCNRAFRDFIGLPYETILRENFLSLLLAFGIRMNGLDLNGLNARFHISGKWFAARSYPYTDFETGNITRVVIILSDVSARKVSEEKVRFVWGIRNPLCFPDDVEDWT